MLGLLTRNTRAYEIREGCKSRQAEEVTRTFYETDDVKNNCIWTTGVFFEVHGCGTLAYLELH